MSIVSQIIWTLLSFWNTAWKGSIFLEIRGKPQKYHYFDQVREDFGQWKKKILFVVEFCYATYDSSDHNLDVQI